VCEIQETSKHYKSKYNTLIFPQCCHEFDVHETQAELKNRCNIWVSLRSTSVFMCGKAVICLLCVCVCVIIKCCILIPNQPFAKKTNREINKERYVWVLFSTF